MPETSQNYIPSAEQHETLAVSPYKLQMPDEFRDDFITHLDAAELGTPIAFSTMQFELNDNTRPLFNALTTTQGDVEFKYDWVARMHARVGKGQAWGLPGVAVYYRGDKKSLKTALTEREELIRAMEEGGLTNLSNRRIQEGQGVMGHDHIKLAFVGETAWFGTMNQRGVDYEVSNFMLKVTDPEMVHFIKEVFEATKKPQVGTDMTYETRNELSEVETMLLMDRGVKGQSVIYEKALEMVGSLQAGDEFVMVNQWPPVKMVFGQLKDVLDAKTARQNIAGMYLLSPKDKLHPLSRTASLMLQKSVDRRAEQDPNMRVVNLRRATHAKALLIKRTNGENEVLFGSHNFAERTVKNGTRELAMWSKDPAIIDQVVSFLESVQAEGQEQ